MQTVPLRPVPAQTEKIILGGQNCQINVYQKPEGIFVDVTADDKTIESCAIARDITPLVSRNYAGFFGNLMFIDTQGNEHPHYSGLGTRFVLLYLSEQEYALIR
jgi:hypothetical protein